VAAVSWPAALLALLRRLRRRRQARLDIDDMAMLAYLGEKNDQKQKDTANNSCLKSS